VPSTSQANATTNTGNADEAILREQTDSLYKAIPISLSASFLNVLILAGLLVDHASHGLIYSWVGFAFMVTVIRGLAWHSYRKQVKNIGEIKRWITLFNLGAILAGISWALPSLLIFPAIDIVHQTFLAFIVAGISAASVSSLAHLRFPIIAFLSLLLLPLTIEYFFLGNIVASAMGFLTFLFYLFNLRSAASFFNSTKQNIELRLKATQNENELRESEQNSRTLVNSVPLGIFHYNAAGEITHCNATLISMLGKTEQQIVGLKLCHDSNNSDEFARAITNSLLGKNGYFSGKTKLINLQGNAKFRAIMRGLYNSDKQIVGGVCVVEDLNDEERVDRLKNEFVSVVSHELRTPLTAIIGSLKLLDSGTIALEDPRAGSMIRMALNNSDRLFHLINNLLDINKLEQQNLSFDDKEINLLLLASEAIEQNKALELSHKVHICLDQSSEPVCVQGDKYRLMQALNNIISNAAKFSPENGLILLRVAKHNERALITVHDNGPGIALEHQGKIFEKFYQIDSTSIRKHQGSGLGLSIAKSIVMQHRGNISVQSQEGCGATFSLDFPIPYKMQHAC